MATPPGWRREGNLPAELTSFVGRTRLLNTIRQRLKDSRLVTVTGIGGVGKSRTVLRIAHQVGGRFRDGVWYVDLAMLQDPGLVYHAVSNALGIVDQTAGSDSLAQWASERELLLILDTCEHLSDACAELTHTLLTRAPGLRIIATSRRSLGAQGESTVAVPPLAVPADDPTESPFTNESVELFRQRATSMVPDFTVDEQNITVVAELCRRLDGIPLAIELAAVRLRVLSVEQILALLSDRFSLLAGASRTALPRHQTLRTAIGWSHELCKPAERLLWARLSVFAGDFELDAVRYVCAGEGVPSSDILELLSSLVEQSILLSHSTPSGQRYRLIDTLRQYGEEWLDKLNETDARRRRHRDYYLQLAERGEEAWSGPRQVHWFVRMRQEHDNIRLAIDHSLRQPNEIRIGLELLSSLWFMWVACGFIREGRHYLERAIAASAQPSKERCKALWVLSYVRSAQGDVQGAAESAERCSTEALQVGDSTAVILATMMLGTAALLAGDLPRATALLGVAIEFHKGSKSLNPGLLPAIGELALVLTAQQDFPEAESLLGDCLRVCEDRGELWLRSYARWILSMIEMATGRLPQAVASAREALRIKRHFHDVAGALLVLETLARLTLTEGHADRAAMILGASEANWSTFGLPQLGSPFLTHEYETSVRQCKEIMGAGQFEETYKAGTILSLEDAIALALGEMEDEEVFTRD